MQQIIVTITWVSMVLVWYKPEYWSYAFKLNVIADVSPCAVTEMCEGCILAGCYKNETMYINPASGAVKEALLHESIHHWQLPGIDFDGFRRPALKYARELSHLPTSEIHAQLPWVLEGKIPPCLQHWYPWFDLERKEADNRIEDVQRRRR